MLPTVFARWYWNFQQSRVEVGCWGDAHAGTELAGEYVWGRYDLLLMPPSFPYGGMENPCLTFGLSHHTLSLLYRALQATSHAVKHAHHAADWLQLPASA